MSNFSEILLKKFGTTKFNPGSMYFRYLNSLYPITEISGNRVYYGEGDPERRNWVTGTNSLWIKNVEVSRRVTGVKVVFDLR